MSREASEKNKDVYVQDTESLAPAPAPGGELHRQLKNRHIAMIRSTSHPSPVFSLARVVPSPTAVPLVLFLGYVTMGTIVYSVMISLGEMIAFLPIPGGHIKLAERFINPAFSFAMGWNYWYNWTIRPVNKFTPRHILLGHILTAMLRLAELSAAAILVNYWHPNVNDAVWVAICIVVVLTINMLGAGAYGEAEFIFASIKVLTITGLIILGIILDLGGGPNHDRLGFRYWKNPGPSFSMMELLAQRVDSLAGGRSLARPPSLSLIAAGEAKNPRRNLPRAIRRVYIRILLFYIGGTFVIGLLVPSNNASLVLESGTAASPFVIAMKSAASAWSAASSDLYTSSRALYGLAASGNAPRIFLKTFQIWIALLSSGAGTAFTWFSEMTSVTGLMTWFGISVTYLRFYKGLQAQGIDRTSLPYYTRLQPFAAWYGCIATFIICFFNGWSVFLKGKWEQRDLCH
ncbi:amino acid permease [Pisolithus marmoratus]|nr:amino acid permease [Pisolithus marmoratus]